MQDILALDVGSVAGLGSFPANLTSPSATLISNATTQITIQAALSSGAPCAQLTVVSAALGTRSGQPGFISQADLNSDGIVNVLDLATAAKAVPAGTVCQ